MRKLIPALSLSVLCGIGGHSFAQTLHYLGGQKLHLLKLLPPPPPPLLMRSSSAFTKISRTYLIMSKEFWSRERPANVSKEVKPLSGPPRLPTAYPSGTTLFGSVTCIVLANMVPEKRFELFERSHDFAWSRVVIGVHFPRDLLAGEIGATLLVQGFFQSPAFMKDFEVARTELRKALGYPPEVPDETPTSSIIPGAN